MKFFYIGDEIPAYYRLRGCCRFAACALCLANVYCARAAQTPATTPTTSHVRAQTKSSHPPQKDAAVANLRDANQTPSLPSKSNTGSGPAAITLKDGILTIEANNSDLSDILKDVARVSGMIINGPIKSARVFGIYGPRNPRDVLTLLLTGSGYNFLMIGVTPEGAPRELQLTLQNGDSTRATASGQAAAAVDTSENSDMNAREQDHVGPGAIIHVPPPPPQDSEERAQQKLQRLQKMHDQHNPPQ
jgi:hypothetical protein